MKNLIKKFIKKTLLVEDAMPLFQKNNIKLNKGVPCYFPQLTASELRGDVSLE